jgi:hypothetical protein
MTYSGHYNRCLYPKTRVIAERLRRAQCYQPLDLFLGEKCRLKAVPVFEAFVSEPEEVEAGFVARL